MSGYLLSIDHGTESLRASIFDCNGNRICYSVSNNTSYYPQSGWVEQSIDQWHKSLINAIKDVIKKSNINPNEILSIGVDATCPTLVLLDKQGKALYNAIMWMDVRATSQAQQISNTNDPVLDCIGGEHLSAEWFLCKILWFKENKPELYEKAKVIFNHADWLIYALTGEIQLNINSDAARNFYNDKWGGHPKSLYKKINLLDVIDKYPQKKTYLGEIAGYVTEEIAEATGLVAGTTVAVPGNDGYIGVVGVNAISPGSMVLITGSSQQIIGLVDKEVHFNGLFGSFPNAILKDKYVIEGGQTSTGSVLKWFKDNFISEKIEAEARNKGISVYEYLDILASEIQPGSDGLVVLEHWQGNRCPWVDSSSRGIIRGLSLRHTPAHIFRAIMEGVAYGTAAIVEKIRESGIVINKLVACGGAVHSDLWMQIMADVLGVQIIIPAETEGVSLGSAIIASVAAGVYPNIPNAAENMVKTKKIINPDLNRTELYKFYLEQYKKTYYKTNSLSKELVEFEERKVH